MTDGLSVCVAQLLLQIRQPPAVTQDVILDVPLEIGNLCDAALEQCMQDDFLLPSHQRSATPATEETHLSSHLVTILVAQEPDRPTDVLQVFGSNTREGIQRHL